jgi:hypothetical protein
MATIKKMQKGGSTSKKKVDNSITGKIQRGVDYMLGSDKLRAAGVAANKAIKPYADKTRTAMNKTLAPIKPKSSVAKMQKGGGVASGVNDIVTGSKKIDNSVARNLKPIAKTAAAIANPIGTGLYKVAGMAGKSADDMLQKRYPNYTGKGTAYSKAKSVAKTVLGYKKGGSKKK